MAPSDQSSSSAGSGGVGSEGGWEVVEDGPGKQRQGQALLAGSPEGGSGKDLHSREQEAFRNSECSGAGAGMLEETGSIGRLWICRGRGLQPGYHGRCHRPATGQVPVATSKVSAHPVGRHRHLFIVSCLRLSRACLGGLSFVLWNPLQS